MGKKISSPCKIVRCWILGGISNHARRKGLCNPCQKWWWSGLGIKFSQTQWDGSSMHPRGPRVFFSFVENVIKQSSYSSRRGGIRMHAHFRKWLEHSVIHNLLVHGHAHNFLVFVFEEPYWLIGPSSNFLEHWSLPNRSTSLDPITK